jgi:hypothetical protein
MGRRTDRRLRLWRWRRAKRPTVRRWDARRQRDPHLERGARPSRGGNPTLTPKYALDFAGKSGVVHAP